MPARKQAQIKELPAFHQKYLGKSPSHPRYLAPRGHISPRYGDNGATVPVAGTTGGGGLDLLRPISCKEDDCSSAVKGCSLR